RRWGGGGRRVGRRGYGWEGRSGVWPGGGGGGLVVGRRRGGGRGAVPDSPAVTGESAEGWRAVRRVLTAHRYELGRVAARLYPEVPRLASADLLCREEWVPALPLELDDLALHWDDGGPGQQGGPGNRGGADAGAARYAE